MCLLIMGMTDQARDRYGRPLRGSREHEVPGIPQRTEISSGQAWTQAMDYLASDLPFHAHETFEQRWRCCPEAERDAWQALAQWAAALTQLARGNPKGARANAEKSVDRLDAALTIPASVDEGLVRASLDQLLR